MGKIVKKLVNCPNCGRFEKKTVKEKEVDRDMHLACGKCGYQMHSGEWANLRDVRSLNQK